MITYSVAELKSLKRDASKHVQRTVRKILFQLHLWSQAKRLTNEPLTVNELPSLNETRTVTETDNSVRTTAATTAVTGEKAYIGLLNVRSIANKSCCVREIINENRLDVFAISETWHQTGDLSLKHCLPTGYCVIDEPRENNEQTGRNYGGVAIVVRNGWGAKKLTFDTKPATFEYVSCSLRSPSANLVCIAIYRPGSQQPTPAFFEELTSFLEQVVTLRSQIIVTGDFNIHVDDPDNLNGRRLLDLLDSFGLGQYVQGATSLCRAHPRLDPSPGLRAPP